MNKYQKCLLDALCHCGFEGTNPITAIGMTLEIKLTHGSTSITDYVLCKIEGIHVDSVGSEDDDGYDEFQINIAVSANGSVIRLIHHLRENRWTSSERTNTSEKFQIKIVS